MISNKQSLSFFAHLAKDNPNEKSVKITTVSDFSDKDAAFLLKYLKSNSEILDLASGSGLIINKIYDKVNHITAVEAFEQFSKFIINTEKITIINQDISKYESKVKFDFILMFGIVQYFNKNEIIDIYSKYRDYLKPGGKLIIKNQFGVDDDVLVSGYSEEIKNNYYSHYRKITNELSILNNIGFDNIEVIDIYPPECNRWTNTHFYAIVAGIS